MKNQPIGDESPSHPRAEQLPVRDSISLHNLTPAEIQKVILVWYLGDGVSRRSHPIGPKPGPAWNPDLPVRSVHA